MTYDSRPDTLKHRAEVHALLDKVIIELARRAHVHDRSKLESPEVEIFNEFTPKLRETTYGSDEYKEHLKGMGEGLEHHYRANRHHPDHWPNGIRDMTLIDLVEMLADWKAATMRHADGSLDRSITHNRERFGYDDDMERLLRRTARDLGWIQ